MDRQEILKEVNLCKTYEEIEVLVEKYKKLTINIEEINFINTVVQSKFNLFLLK